MSILDGITEADLQARLTALQNAYLDLSSGAKIVTAAYTQGDGSRSVTYTQSRLGELTQAILAVQRQLATLSGLTFTGRAPLRPIFRG